ncbi:MAG TPA: hypothetical protein VK525_02640 [Candidatus Saccharimonadales bacterium]|nr:hypothetical protein [Candidatus Saccharimonadales bacterium]
MTKRAYGAPRLMQLESRVSSEPEWDLAGESKASEHLQPFYVLYSKREFLVIAACLKFTGDQTYRDWHPVVPQDSAPRSASELFQCILIGYVPQAIYFSLKLKLLSPQARQGVAVVPDLIARQDRSFQSIYLEVPSSRQSSATYA